MRIICLLILLLSLSFCNRNKSGNTNIPATSKLAKIQKIEIVLQTDSGLCKITPSINDSIIDFLLQRLALVDQKRPEDIIRRIAIVNKGLVIREYLDTTSGLNNISKSLDLSWPKTGNDSTSFEACGCEAPHDSLRISGKADTTLYIRFCNQVKKVSGKTIKILPLSRREVELVQCVWEVIRKKYSMSGYCCTSGSQTFPFFTKDIFVDGKWHIARQFCEISRVIANVLMNSMDSNRDINVSVLVPLFFQNNEFKIGRVFGENLNPETASKIGKAINAKMAGRISIEHGDTIKVTYTNYELLYGL